MKEGIVLESSDIKEIIAEYFNVPIENVVQTKYSYIVIKGKEKKNEGD